MDFTAPRLTQSVDARTHRALSPGSSLDEEWFAADSRDDPVTTGGVAAVLRPPASTVQ